MTSGDRNGEDTYAEAHNEFLNVKERIQLTPWEVISLVVAQTYSFPGGIYGNVLPG